MVRSRRRLAGLVFIVLGASACVIWLPSLFLPHPVWAFPYVAGNFLAGGSYVWLVYPEARWVPAGVVPLLLGLMLRRGWRWSGRLAAVLTVPVIVVDLLELLYLLGQLNKGIDYVLPAAVLAIGLPVKFWALYLCLPPRHDDQPHTNSVPAPEQR